MSEPPPQPADPPTGANIAGDQMMPGAQIDGDKIIVGNISDSTGVAIGAGAQAIVNRIDTNITQQALSPVDEADKARANALRILAENVRDYAQRLIQLATQKHIGQPSEPYHGLVAYTLSDAELFFGRQQATSELLARIRTNRLTILQAESGAGKSSLLQAGIAPQLMLQNHLPVILRPYDLSPTIAIKQTFLTGLENNTEFQTTPLRHFLQAVTRVLGQSITVYIILDQFEEFFTSLKDTTNRTASAIRSRFIHELADCLEDQSLNVAWVLAVRSEFFGEFASFRPRIPNPFANDYRLNRLTRAEAQAVITAPALQSQISFEPQLITAILNDLQQPDGQLAPPQIQLVCQALYQSFKEAKDQSGTPPDTITLALYEKEERAQGILRRYLHRTLIRAFPTQAEQELGRRLLIELISSDQRRLLVTHSKLMQRLAPALSTAQSLDRVLKILVDTHLVITAQADDDAEATYELAHDYLLEEIQVDPVMQAQKIAQELLQQEVEAYQRFKTLISKDKFTILNSQRTLLVLDEQAEALLKLSEAKIHQEEQAQEAARQRELSQAQALAAEQTSRARTSRWAAIITGVLLVIALIGSYIAYDRQRAAVAAQVAAQVEAANAQSRALTFASQAAVTTNSMRPWLLAIEAGRLADTDQAFTAINQQDQALGKPLIALTHDGYVYGAAWNEEESRILSWSDDGNIRVWEATSGDLLHTLTHDGAVRGAVWNGDESRILTWSSVGTIRMWEATSGDLLHTLTHDGAVRGAVWNGDESRILSWSDDNTIRVWEATSGDLLHTLTHESSVNGAAWNGDESRILSWGGDYPYGTYGTTWVWEATSGDLLHTLTHESSVNGAAWNGDESRILSWNADGTARLWDPQTERTLLSFFGDGTNVSSVQWNRDESQLMITTGDGRIYRYYTHMTDLLAAACMRATRNFNWFEWQQYMPGEPYHQTCPNLPPHPSVPADALVAAGIPPVATPQAPISPTPRP